MNGAVSYILTVTAAAILTAVLLSFAGAGSMNGLVKLLAGVFMAVTVVSPLLKLELPDAEQWISEYAADGELAAARGEEMANDARRAIIKTELEAYILDKAAELGADLSAHVTLNEDGIPVSVSLNGEVPSSVQAKLSRIIQTDLGLGEEAQRWSG